jgi:hypothetical protein
MNVRPLVLPALVALCTAAAGWGSSGTQEAPPAAAPPSAPAAPAAPAAAEPPAVTLEAGDPAPGFSLAGSDGKTYRLGDFKGKRAVVLAWFPKAFTGG